MREPDVSIIVPVYQEERRIAATLDTIRGFLEPRRPFEVIVVDDGSRDRTAAVVSDYAVRHPSVRLIRLADNRGKGAAVRAGVLASRGSVICFCDADLAMPITHVEQVLALSRRDEVVIASRTLPGSEILVRQGLARRVMGRAFNALVRALFALPFGDTQCGFKGFRRDAALAIFPRLRIDGFAFDVELLVVARRLGCRIGEMPVRVDHSAASTVSLLSHAWPIGRDLWRIARNLRRGLYDGPRTPAGPRQRLSAVILTKNEEARVARCLESIRWADEIIVVDGLSTDRTAEICRRYGARVIPHPFSGDFGLERNVGNDMASGEWILQLDADDVVSPSLRADIERILRDGSPHAAYKFRRKSWFLGHAMRHGGWYHYYPHLFRRGQAHFEGRVHHLLRTEGPMGALEGVLEHYPFDRIEQFVARHNRYTAIEAQEMLEKDGLLDARLVRYHLTRRPLKLFWKIYVKKQGFREGWHGLVFSILYAWVHFLKWAKYWELRTAALQPPTTEPGYPPTSGASPEAAGRGTPPATRCLRKETLSVVLMTKNEEARLSACLDRVTGWADEIVIIDDLSADRTVEIARRYTDKVFSFASEDNHDLQWNRGIERATGDWILHLDADEVVSPQLTAAIDQRLADARDYGAFELMRKNFFLGHPMRFGGWYHRHLVLFRRAVSRCVGKGIHVQLKVDGRIGFLDAELEHYPFSSITQFIERQNHYTSVEAPLLFERRGPVSARALAYQLCCRPMKLFWKSYRKQQGCREGEHGLVFAILYAFVHAIFWAKHWECLAASPRIAAEPAASVTAEAVR
ncbi:MAG: glycosyltransferase [Candidatus Omnitrophica bacterium]|nr:glycosyltransferase [Candidatus Omnitrophota bacterium]